MIVIRIAITASLKASSRVLFMPLWLYPLLYQHGPRIIGATNALRSTRRARRRRGRHTERRSGALGWRTRISFLRKPGSAWSLSPRGFPSSRLGIRDIVMDLGTAAHEDGRRGARVLSRSRGCCRPLLSPLRIVAQHGRGPSSATNPFASAAAYSASSTSTCSSALGPCGEGASRPGRPLPHTQRPRGGATTRRRAAGGQPH
jgi:hypothetical protein